MTLSVLIGVVVMMECMRMVVNQAIKAVGDDACPPGSIYLSPNGTDLGNGTIDNPFNSLDSAFEDLNTTCGTAGGIVICVLPGIYRLDVLKNVSSPTPCSVSIYSSVQTDQMAVFQGQSGGFYLSNISLSISGIEFSGDILQFEISNADLSITNSKLNLNITSINCHNNGSVSLNSSSFGVSKTKVEYCNSLTVTKSSAASFDSLGVKKIAFHGVTFSGHGSQTITDSDECEIINCTFHSISTDVVVLTLLSRTKNLTYCNIINNSFINNTLQINTESVVYTRNSVGTLKGNYFSFNTYPLESQFRSVLPFSSTPPSIWTIIDNVLDPSCPYPCPEATEYKDQGMTGCQKCSTGSVSPGNGASCTACPPGTYAAFDKCSDCPAGSVSPGNTSSCTHCIDNTITNTNHTACIPCPDNSITHEGQTCIPCPDNDYVSGTTCVPCPMNHYASHGSCYPCPLHSYASNGSCHACPSFHYAYNRSCHACPVDAVVGKNESCITCPAGHYTAPNNTCLVCPFNHHASSTNRTCIPCRTSDTNTAGCIYIQCNVFFSASSNCSALSSAGIVIICVVLGAIFLLLQLLISLYLAKKKSSRYDYYSRSSWE